MRKDGQAGHNNIETRKVKILTVKSVCVKVDQIDNSTRAFNRMDKNTRLFGKKSYLIVSYTV